MTTTPANHTQTVDCLWRATRQRREVTQIATLLPRILEAPRGSGSSPLARRMVSQFARWEPLVEDSINTVYRAQDVETGQAFAMKCLGPRPTRRTDGIRLFEAEIAAMAAVNHPGVPQLHGTGRLADGRPFFVMDYVPGQTLENFVMASQGARQISTRRDGTWLHGALQAFAQCCRVVAHAHGRGVVHADLNPANMIFATDRAYVVDWGAARMRGRLLAKTPEPMPQFLGTPAYMSPEQAAGALDVGISSDIYSLGASLYYVLTGRPPILGRRLPEVIASVCCGDFPAPRQIDGHIPHALDAICQKAMAKQPGARFDNVSELVSSIEGWVEQSPLRAFAARWADWLLAVATPADDEIDLMVEASSATA